MVLCSIRLFSGYLLNKVIHLGANLLMVNQTGSISENIESVYEDNLHGLSCGEKELVNIP